MTDLRCLGQRVEALLAATAERRQSHPRADQWQRHLRARRARAFKSLIEGVERIIQPRMRLLAGYFENSEFLLGHQGAGHFTCRFESTARFPASARLELAVVHDRDFDNLLVVYCLELLPAPVALQHQRRDEISFGRDGVDLDRIRQWVDDKLVAFVETYLRLEHSESYQRREAEGDSNDHQQRR